jgi:hypothetical protein
MSYPFDYSKDKDLILKSTRGIGFDDIIKAVREGNILDDLEHTKKGGYAHQKLLIVNINGYAYVAPYVIDPVRKVRFIKTVYPSRKLTKIYLKKDNL